LYNSESVEKNSFFSKEKDVSTSKFNSLNDNSNSNNTVNLSSKLTTKAMNTSSHSKSPHHKHLMPSPKHPKYNIDGDTHSSVNLTTTSKNNIYDDAYQNSSKFSKSLEKRIQNMKENSNSTPDLNESPITQKETGKKNPFRTNKSTGNLDIPSLKKSPASTPRDSTLDDHSFRSNAQNMSSVQTNAHKHTWENREREW